MKWMKAAIVVLSATSGAVSAAGTITMTQRELLDRIKGGWAGQMIGVVVAGPTEFKAQSELYTKPLDWTASKIGDALDQDDLYVEMTFARVLDKEGLDAPAASFAKAFAASEYRLWHANFCGRLNVRNGIMPPESGHPKHNIHADDIDFQIEADFIGLMCPGMPVMSNLYCDRVGHIMNYGDGVYGGMFVAAMYAAAFVEKDVEKVLQAGLAVIPTESLFHRAVSDAIAFHREFPDDLDAAWAKFEKKWVNRDLCPEGVLKPYDIDAKVNSAYIALGLLYGKGDLQKTITSAVRCGQDSDCNASSVAGVLGAMYGWEWIPADWRGELEKVQDDKFKFTEYSFRTICESSLKNALALVKRAGGTVDGDTVAIVRQAPKRAPLEQWKQDKPVARVGPDDPRFEYQGTWVKDKELRTSKAAGDRVEFTFEGTGAMIFGTYADDQGIAEVLLDGQLQGKVNMYHNWKALRRGPRDFESLFHIMGLPRGVHRLTVVVSGDKGPQAEAANVTVSGAVVYDGPEPEPE